MVLYDKRNLIHIIVILGLIAALPERVLSVVVFVSITIIVIVTLQVWILNILMVVGAQIRKSDIWFQQVFFILIVLYQIPVLVKKHYLYNLYPFCGWIGSVTNAAQKGDYGLVTIYFIFVSSLLVIGLRVGTSLMKPKKKLRNDS